MKVLMLLLSFGWNLVFSTSMIHSISAPTHKQVHSYEGEHENDVWGYLAAGAGVVGLILITLPYLSLLGLILGIAGLVMGIFFRKRIKRRKWLATLGIVAGSLCLGLFFAVVGLVLFF